MVVRKTTAIGLFSKVYCLLFNVLFRSSSFRCGTFFIVPSFILFVNIFFKYFLIFFHPFWGQNNKLVIWLFYIKIVISFLLIYIYKIYIIFSLDWHFNYITISFFQSQHFFKFFIGYFLIFFWKFLKFFLCFFHCTFFHYFFCNLANYSHKRCDNSIFF